MGSRHVSLGNLAISEIGFDRVELREHIAELEEEMPYDRCSSVVKDGGPAERCYLPEDHEGYCDYSQWSLLCRLGKHLEFADRRCVCRERVFRHLEVVR